MKSESSDDVEEWKTYLLVCLLDSCLVNQQKEPAYSIQPYQQNLSFIYV